MEKYFVHAVVVMCGSHVGPKVRLSFMDKQMNDEFMDGSWRVEDRLNVKIHIHVVVFTRAHSPRYAHYIWYTYDGRLACIPMLPRAVVLGGERRSWHPVAAEELAN